MASPRVDSGVRDRSAHSIAFRVMRLCRPALQVDAPLRCRPQDLRDGEDDAAAPSLPPLPDEPFMGRAEPRGTMDAFGMNGMLVLPQTFGSIYLGETFCSYISVGNHSSHDVGPVAVKAELQTERQRTLLLDNTSAPLPVLRAGGRYDFIIEHDIKELGAHTLVCSAAYFDVDGERKFLPQYFKFTAANPLAVRTKVRVVRPATSPKPAPESSTSPDTSTPRKAASTPRKVAFTSPEAASPPPENASPSPDSASTFLEPSPTFLEVCIENCTKHPLFLDAVKFEPAVGLTVTVVEATGEKPAVHDSPLSSLLNRMILLRPTGGSRYFLYKLNRRPPPTTPAQPSPTSAAGAGLGKLEIMWRTTLGESGRLQTQQILGTPVPRKDVELRLRSMPDSIALEAPFTMRCSLHNNTDAGVGPLRVVVAREESGEDKQAVVACGQWSQVVDGLGPHASTDVNIGLVALASGVQRIVGIAVVDVRERRPWDTLQPVDIFVRA